MIDGAAVALELAPGLQGREADERRRVERPLVQRAWRQYLHVDASEELGEVHWRDDGKPTLQGRRAEGLDVSLSHDDTYVMCVVGASPQGCDLEPIASRSSDDWQALLGSKRFGLAQALGGCLDTACTRVWSAVEAARKATGSMTVDLDLDLDDHAKDSDTVVLLAITPDQRLRVATSVVALSRGPRRVVAYCRPTSEPKLPTAAPTKRSDIAAPLGMDVVYDEALGCHALQWEFLVGHRDAPALSRSVMWSRFMPWYGRLRDLILGEEVGREFTEEILRGEAGGVTHSVTGEFHGRVTAYDRVRARIAVISMAEEVCTMQAWFDRDDGTPLAVIRNDTSLARLDAHGHLRAASVPRSHYLRYEPFLIERPVAAFPTPSIVDGRLFAAAAGPAGGPCVHRERFRTSLEDANLIGNVYFATHFSLHQRAVDLLLHGIAPSLFGSHAVAELACRRVAIRYVRDAMPFDTIEVDVRLQSLGECTAELRCDFFRIDPDHARVKLAVATQSIAWVRIADARPEPWPAALVDGLLAATRSPQPTENRK